MTEKIEFAMNLSAVLLIERLAQERNCSTEEAFFIFMKSKTAQMLYDDSTKLWWDGTEAILENLNRENNIFIQDFNNQSAPADTSKNARF